MKEKRFQIIDWSESDFVNNNIKLSLMTYSKYNEIKEDIKKKNYVIAIGYNPSNKTIFNDDTTNLYLRDKIYNYFKNKPQVDGYILVNLIPRICEDSNEIKISDLKEDYIKDILKLIGANEKEIILFFGQLGIKLLNGNNEEIKKLKEKLIQCRDRVLYTSRPESFVHPGRSGDNYEIVKWKKGLLDS